MADNVAITAGSGTPIASDEISGVHYQRVKLSIGADGSAADAPGDSTDGFKVQAKAVEAGKTRISLRVAVTASQTGSTVWDPAAGKKFVLTKLVVSAKTAGDIQLFDGTDSGNTVVTPIMSLNAGGGFVMDWPVHWPYRSAAADNILKFTTGTVITGSIYVEGWEE